MVQLEEIEMANDKEQKPIVPEDMNTLPKTPMCRHLGDIEHAEYVKEEEDMISGFNKTDERRKKYSEAGDFFLSVLVLFLIALVVLSGCNCTSGHDAISKTVCADDKDYQNNRNNARTDF